MAHKLRFLSALMFGIFAASGAGATTVVLGSDYFETGAGTSFNFGGAIGTVDFVGDPIGPGRTDSIIQRTSDITVGDTGTITMTALSLMSANPVMGQTWYLTLDPSTASNGTITIDASTFTSTLDLNFDICAAPGANGVGCMGGAAPIMTESVMLSSSSTPWTSTPPPGAVIVKGALGSQTANLHSGLGAGEVDFFVGVSLMQVPAVSGVDFVEPLASAPEPSTWAMLTVGFGGLGAAAFARRRRAPSPAR